MRLAPVHMEHAVRITSGAETLEGRLVLPAGATGMVVFAAGNGSSADDSQYRYVAAHLQRSGLGTLLFDEQAVAQTAEFRTRMDRLNIPLLAERLVHATRWINAERDLRGLRVGCFAAGATSAAALAAAAGLGSRVSAVAVRGGRPDLAGAHLERITAATLFIVTSADRAMLEVNEAAYERLHCTKRLVVAPGATHRFDEGSALGEVASLAGDWFQDHIEAAVRT